MVVVCAHRGLGLLLLLSLSLWASAARAQGCPALPSGYTCSGATAQTTSCTGSGAAVDCIVSGVDHPAGAFDPTTGSFSGPWSGGGDPRTPNLHQGNPVVLSNRVQFRNVCVVCGGQIAVKGYDWNDATCTKASCGNLELVAQHLYVDNNVNTTNGLTSSITATGSGYRGRLCDHGDGPVATTGGRGGCAIFDSGGGGGHFGVGGRGTHDVGTCSPWDDPHMFEEDCQTGGPNAGKTACTLYTNCRTCDGLPSVAGGSFRHSIYEPEFGAAGGDKGCRDGDGFVPFNSGGGNSGPGWGTGGIYGMAGWGGGRVVLVGLAGGAGTVWIDGQVTADGTGGCGTGNDSSGGGAGGTVLIVGDVVTMGPSALVSAAGGQGGDSQGLNGTTKHRLDCPPIPTTGAQTGGAQQGGTCDDCGGGGGGGIINVQSAIEANLDPRVHFNVRAGLGGVCPICSGEAGGGAGELQLESGYVGELCDDYDNDFSGTNNDGLPQSCASGQPWVCTQTAGHYAPSFCHANYVCPANSDTRPRFVLIVDTSGSMLQTTAGRSTFGDGSEGHQGADLNGDLIEGNDAKLFMAKNALTHVIAAYPEIDFALARYHQDELPDRSCQLAHWMECNQACCSYDDPRNNRPDGGLDRVDGGGPACSLYVGFGSHSDGGLGAAATVVTADAGTVPVYNVPATTHEECINYAGTCGSPRRGADIVAGFGSPIDQYLMWLDGKERNFNPDATPGNYCDFTMGGDCELRATGPTPLAGALQAAEDYILQTRGLDTTTYPGCDPANRCRKYAIILLTDGAESCALDANGQVDLTAATTAAATLYSADAITGTDGLPHGVETYVVGFSVLAAEQAQLNQIARAGSGNTRDAYLVGKEEDLANALAAIVASGIVYEKCNGLDDNCNGLTDESWPEKGQACAVGVGECRVTGTYICKPDGSGTCCSADGTTCASPKAPQPEVCNGKDDNCNGATDEGLDCTERCDGIDNNGNGQTDEGFPVGQACTNGLRGECARAGVYVCSADHLGVTCTAPAAAPTDETCDCKDNNCNGLTDEGVVRDCYSGSAGTRDVGICHGGVQVCATTPGPACVANVWSAQCVGEQTPVAEICNNLDDNCDGQTDEGLTQGYYDGPAGTRGVGECRDGLETCAAGVWGVTQAEVLPQPEACNGLDDDCNGLTDDGLAAVSCYPDATPGCDPATRVCVGVCRTGTKACVAGQWGACQGAVSPTPEQCNGLDDDCDGQTDNPPPGTELPGVGVACQTLGGCPGTTICDPNARAVVCQPTSGGVEVCNGTDDDCDGQIDELPSPGEPPLCDPTGAKCAGVACVPDVPTGVHVCTPGRYACINGVMDCLGAVLSTPEVCNGLDDDCNGQTDEGDLCDPGSVCYQGRCVVPCTADEFPCPGGQVCLDGTNLGARVTCGHPGTDTCFCIPSACLNVSCQAGWQCREADGQCHDLCAGVTCAANQECASGRCVDCSVLGCPAGEVCAGGTCQTNTCASVSCPTGSYCMQGECVSSCELVSCGRGTVCVGGQCVSDLCTTTYCSVSQFCNPETGECTSNPCLATSCPDGTLCSTKSGQCLTDPCLMTTCDSCSQCRADAYWQRATCELRPECAQLTITAAGGGCRAGGPGGGPPLLLAFVLVLGAARARRTRRGR
jgi:hypothetical protein